MLGLGGTEGGGNNNNNNINNNNIIISSNNSNGGGSPHHLSSAVAPPPPTFTMVQVQEQNGCSSGLERPTPRRGAIPSLDVDSSSNASRPNGGSSHPSSPGAAFQGPSPMVTQRSNNSNSNKPLLMATGHVKMELGQGALDLNHHGSSRGSELDLNAFGWER